MWSERHPLNQQLIPLILGFFLVFWAATSLTWYTQLRRMRIFSLEASASHLAAPLFDAARRKLDGLVFAQWQLDSLHTWLKVRVARLMPALPETGVNIEALLLVDAQGRILFSSQEETAAGVAPRPLSNVVSTQRRMGRIEVTVPLIKGQEVLAGIVCLYDTAAVEVADCRCFHIGLGVMLLLSLVGATGAIRLCLGLTRSLRQLVARSEHIGPKAGSQAVLPRHAGEFVRLSASLDRLEQWLSDVESRSRILFTAIENAGEEVVVTDRHGRIQYVNPAFVKNSGYQSAEVMDKNPRLLKSGEHHPTFYQEMWQTLLDGNIWRGRFINRCKDGRRSFLDATISPIVDSMGTISGFVAVRRDVGEMVQMERQLVQSQKMEAIGTLAGGIAHDFNNILAGILGYTELAMLALSPDSGVHAKLTHVRLAAERARELVQQILTYSRQSKSKPSLLMMRPLLKEILDLLRASFPANIHIDRQLSRAGSVFADATQVHQIVMNLCTNAAHAMAPGGGTLTVVLEKVALGAEEDPGLTGVSPGDYVHMAFSDTGHGMPLGVQKRVFDPYFTTKERGKGTGMGLAVVHGIVRQLGGRVILHSEEGVGSRFDVYLPAVDAVADSQHAEGQLLYHGQGVAFFVDDESALVDIGCSMMAHMGFEPVGFDSSRAALEAFEADPEGVALVVTDMTMPEMTGDELAKRLLVLRPDLPIIICSGFSEHMDEIKATELGVSAFLYKPFSIIDLAAAVGSALPQDPPAEADA